MPRSGLSFSPLLRAIELIVRAYYLLGPRGGDWDGLGPPLLPLTLRGGGGGGGGGGLGLVIVGILHVQIAEIKRN